LALQFVDHRDPGVIEHSVQELVAQRLFGLALGYEDLNDHDRLRLRTLLAVLVGKEDPTGQDRFCPRDQGKPLASSSTLNRLELTPEDADARSRYNEDRGQPGGDGDRLLVECFLEAHGQPPEEIWIDLDATDDTLHGRQKGASATATTAATAIYRSTSSAVSTCCARGCANPRRITGSSGAASNERCATPPR